MFVNVHRCVECKKELTETQRMYSQGRCPLCGHKGKSAVTIVDTEEFARKLTKIDTLFRKLKIPFLILLLSTLIIGLLLFMRIQTEILFDTLEKEFGPIIQKKDK